MTSSTPQPTPARTPRVSRRGLIGGVTLALAGGGTAWALDRFVIEHAQVTDASSLWADTTRTSSDAGTSTAAQTADAGTVDGQTYRSDNATITVERHSTGSGDDALVWFVADLQLASATVLRTALAKDTYGENILQYPSDIAAANDAIWAINGDYYGFRSTGIVIRNGVAFRDKGARQGLALHSDGSLRLCDETATTADQLVADGVWQTWSFGPGLVSDGAIVAGIDQVEVDTNPGNHSIQGSQPRTGLGMIAPNHLVAVVADGRADGYSRGVTMSEFAQLFVDLGAQVAYNLDGGGSSTMLFDDQLVNNPLGRNKERGTSDIIHVER